MTESQKKILEMLAQNKINTDEAYRLLNAVEGGEGEPYGAAGEAVKTKAKPKYLRVTVLPDPERANGQDVDRINVRVPMSLIHAGIKLTSLIPPEARDKVNDALQEKGIRFDVNSVKTEDIEELVDALSELEVDVVSAKGEKIRVFVE